MYSILISTFIHICTYDVYIMGHSIFHCTPPGTVKNGLTQWLLHVYHLFLLHAQVYEQKGGTGKKRPGHVISSVVNRPPGVMTVS